MSQGSVDMEDSYTVHRRRKAAARKREKTPDPPRLNENVSDDDQEETRARMEKMVEDTEKMEKREEVERSETEPTRPNRKASLKENRGGSSAEKQEPEVSTPRKLDLNAEESSRNRADTKEARDDDAREAARSVMSKEVSQEVEKEEEEEEEETKKSENKLKEKTESEEKVKPSLGMTEVSGDVVKMTKNRRNDEKSVKKRSKERLEGRRSYTTDSSDTEERGRGSGLRRRKSPEGARSRSGGGRKPTSRSRGMIDSDEDEDFDTSRNDSFTERSRSTREKRLSSKHRYSTGTDEDSALRKEDSFVKGTYVEIEEQTRREEKPKIRDRRSTSRHMYPSDTDEDSKTMKKSETFPQRKIEKSFIKRSASEVKKQIIPLSNDSLIQDFAKAQQEYLRKEVGILDPNPDSIEIFYTANEKTSLRRRKTSLIHTEPEKEEIAKMVASKRSWFSWLPFIRKKEKEIKGASTKIIEVQKEKKKDLEKKVSFLEFLMVLRDAVSELKAFIEQNPKEIKVIRTLRNRCMAELLLMIIYCGLGAFVFRFTEGAFETFYKCGVKRVKRDFLDSLWNYSHNMREDDWKSMARRKLMEFEEQLHTAHDAGLHTYSGQRSWSFLNAVVYCLTVITTIGYGHISPSTTTGRALTIVYAIFGIPMFLIILADFGKLFTRCIKFLWAFVRRVYYTGSCRKVRRTGPVQEVMKGVQLVYDFATFRRPSQINPEDIEEMQKQGNQTQTVLNLDGNMPQPDTPGTPAMSNFAIDDEFNLPISVAIFILLVYIFVGATIYYMWEDWGFFESFYFVFISMSTIGFGDYVPQHPIYMMCSIVYLVFGLALTSMCINVVQVMLSDSFKQASQKIGATIGLEVAEDNGSIQAIAPPLVELADIHMAAKDSSSKEKIAPKAKQEDVDL